MEDWSDGVMGFVGRARVLALTMLFPGTNMSRAVRSRIFLVFFIHREYGPLVGGLLVSPKPGGLWQMEWDIGTIDRDPQLSDDWFCQKRYEQRFVQVLEAAVGK
jgi:hypothetical protein